jgi:hypothetical protein
MRNNIWNLVWGVIGLVIVVLTFVNNNTVKVVFGFELNIWVYRAIWSLIAAGSLFSYFKRRNEESN